MPKRLPSAACPHELLSPHDLHVVHQTQGQGTSDHAFKNEAATDAAAGAEDQRIGAQRAALRVPKLPEHAPHQGNAEVACKLSGGLVSKGANSKRELGLDEQQSLVRGEADSKRARRR